MSPPIVALAWEIWRPRRQIPFYLLGCLALAWIGERVLPADIHALAVERGWLSTVKWMFLGFSVAGVFLCFNYTEFNPQTEWTGFPYRLFALPVPTWLLVTLPAALGFVSVELVYWAWAVLVFNDSELTTPGWFAVLAGVYMIYFQTILWTLAGFRVLRIVFLGLIGTGFVALALVPSLSQEVASPWLSERILISVLGIAAAGALLGAWASVDAQRHSGGKRRKWITPLVDRVGDILPRRKRGFASAIGAQFWYEWRSAGSVLPWCVTAVLVLIVAPLSWFLRADPSSFLWILMWTMATPAILSIFVGYGLSKGNFWGPDMQIPSFITTRPLTNEDLVAVKMKVAAASAALAWLLITGFLALWFSCWANLDALSMLRVGYWMAYGHTQAPQCLIAMLLLVAGAFLTWRFLVNPLWIGLSGSQARVIASGAVYILLIALGLAALAAAINRDAEVRAWIHWDPNRLLSILEWLAAVLLIAKAWAATVWWRSISLRRARAYALFWLCSASILIVLAILLWARGALVLALMAFCGFLPLDPVRLRNLLILGALLLIPLARPALAPGVLAKNRHR